MAMIDIRRELLATLAVYSRIQTTVAIDPYTTILQ